jgi:hypothetical protein
MGGPQRDDDAVAPVSRLVVVVDGGQVDQKLVVDGDVRPGAR